MKTPNTSRIILALLLAASGAQATTTNLCREVHFGLSPLYAREDRERIHAALEDFVLTTAPASTVVTLWDGCALRTIARLEVPQLHYPSQRARALRLAAPLADVGRWFEEMATNRLPSDLQGTANLLVPQLIELICAQPGGSNRAIVMVGSPLIRDPREPAFSMDAGGRYPSDVHIRANPSESPFGVGDATNRLRSAVVHWIHPDAHQRFWETELHRYQVRRFWLGWVQTQGGRLARFDADLKLTTVLQADLPALGTFTPDPDAKLEMRVARPRELPVWMPESILKPAGSGNAHTNPTPPAPTKAPRPVQRPPAPAPARPAVTNVTVDVSTNALPLLPAAPTNSPPAAPEPAAAAAAPQPTTNSAAPAQTTPPIRLPISHGLDKVEFAIGLMWSQRADVDLYVRPRPGAAELYYRNTHTRDGIYYHDYRSRNDEAGRGRLDYECVEITSPVSLADVRAWANYYSGSAPAPSGVVVVWYRGQQFTAEFTIPAPHGNRGADGAHRQTSSYWVEIPIAKIIGASAAQ